MRHSEQSSATLHGLTGAGRLLQPTRRQQMACPDPFDPAALSVYWLRRRPDWNGPGGAHLRFDLCVTRPARHVFVCRDPINNLEVDG